MSTTANREIVAGLMTFDKNGEGNEIIDENVLLEVTNLTKDSRIEIAYNDRNERVYLQFSLSELLALACQEHCRE